MKNILQRILIGCLIFLLLPSETLASNIFMASTNDSDINLIVTDGNEDDNSDYITTDTSSYEEDSDVAMAGDADEVYVEAVSFTDVPDDSWYLNYVLDLAAQGIIGGFEDGSFRPNDAVTYAQALKMIMLAAGYDEQSPTSSHWASGYLTCAIADRLLPNTTINLDQKISRYAIAEITSKALNLSPTTDGSPFSDVPTSIPSAPYVLALYQTGIIQGSTSPSGSLVYDGDSFIKRSEIAAIIWRIDNYRSNN